ncbi:hypothetical protein MNBD_NITROSPINAE01-435, partial [hydrothermal vent metagenome]
MNVIAGTAGGSAIWANCMSDPLKGKQQKLTRPEVAMSRAVTGMLRRRGLQILFALAFTWL